MSVPTANPSAAWFVKELTTAHVFEAAQLAPYLAEFKALHRGGDAVALADYLVNCGLLTRYQANRCLAHEASKLVLGPYLIAEPVGSGTIGDVFQAIGRSDRKRYAVKVLPLRSLWNVRQAKKQVEAFAKLPPHPAVVPFLDVDSAGGHHYLAWPYIEGVTLAQRVREKGPASVAAALMVMTQVAEGLAVCHAHGIAHGLFSPAHVLIGVDGQVRIRGLGMGAILSENIADDESMLDTMSSASAAMGMLEWCAPETLNSPTLRDPAGDIYSFGCVFYFLLAGQSPFPDGNMVDKVLAHQTLPPPAVRALNPNVPAWLDDLIQRLLSKTPSRRPASIDQVLSKLLAGSSEAFVELPPVPPGEAAPAPPPAPPASLTPKPQIHVETPRQMHVSTPTPWQPPAPSANRGPAGPPSASEIDFGDYAPPDDGRDRPWAVPPRRSDPAQDSPIILLSPAAAASPPVVPIILKGAEYPTVLPVEETPRPAARRVSTALPAPLTYTATDAPAAAVAFTAPAPPTFRRSLWERLKSFFTPIRPPVADTVQLSVFGPATVSPGDSIKLQVFAHSPELFDSVNTLARAFHAAAAPLATGYVTRPVERAAALALHLKVANAGVAHSHLTLMWLGQPQPRAFDVHVPWESPSGLTAVRLSAGVNGQESGQIDFQLHVLPRRG
jgi:serine/threonine protein kinase